MKLVPLAEIAKGGMGSVQLARAEGGRLHGHAIAIKRLHANIAQDPQFVGMFLDPTLVSAWAHLDDSVRTGRVAFDELFGDDFFGHLAEHPEKSRAAELSLAATDVLVINGSRDPFGIPDQAARTRVVVLEGETHALSRNPGKAGAVAAAWLADLPGLAHT